ncbi:hypothetical protein JB92DRAFT_2825266 [Gautieria morchelliformis]|nr:hypothetical protein JB92DRAFT_2825266 [Gautieria morchelliformis]
MHSLGKRTVIYEGSWVLSTKSSIPPAGMRQLYELLRKAFSVLRANGPWCLRTILHVWQLFKQRIRLHFPSNQQAYIPEKPESLPTCTKIIVASRIPESYFLEEHPPSNGTSLHGSSSTQAESSSSSSSHASTRQTTIPRLHIRETPRRQSTSATFFPCGTTFASPLQGSSSTEALSSSSSHASTRRTPRLPGLDIRETPRRQSTSATFSSGTTLVSSPLTVSPCGSHPLPGCKDESATDEFKPKITAPAKSRRYDPRPRYDVDSRPIPAGSPSVSRERKYGLPPNWQQYIHPEGQIYFVHARESAPCINVITDADAYDSKVQNAASHFADKILTRAADFWTFDDPAHVELMVDVDVDVDVDDPAAFSYYFIDHKNAVIFWMDEVSTDGIGIPDVSGTAHLRTHIQTQYWLHQEYFPCHREVSEKDERELNATLAQNCIDFMTCNTSTSLYESPRLESILGITNNLTNFEGIHGQRNWIVARLWKSILESRAVNHFGERGARLYRTQIEEEESSSPIFMKFIFFLLFGAPSIHLRSLRKLYPDNVIYTYGWQKYMEALCNEWHNMILWATVLLAANMSFLAIFNSTDQVIQENQAVTCSIVSTLSSTVSIVIGMLLVRPGPLADRQAEAEDGAKYLLKETHDGLGLRPLAIVYSLSYACLMWAMVTYIAAILLFVFKSGLSMISQAVISAIAVSLGATLAWVIQRFWHHDHELHCRDSVRSLSPVALIRLLGRVTARARIPEAANAFIVPNWLRRVTTRREVADTALPSAHGPQGP